MPVFALQWLSALHSEQAPARSQLNVFTLKSNCQLAEKTVFKSSKILLSKIKIVKISNAFSALQLLVFTKTGKILVLILRQSILLNFQHEIFQKWTEDVLEQAPDLYYTSLKLQHYFLENTIIAGSLSSKFKRSDHY